MQVKYIWIEEYKNLKSIGFNLKSGSNEIFEYVDGTLKISHPEDNFPSAFYSKNIKGTTAIVGRNGSGSIVARISYPITNPQSGHSFSSIPIFAEQAGQKSVLEYIKSLFEWLIFSALGLLTFAILNSVLLFPKSGVRFLIQYSWTRFFLSSTIKK